LPDSEAQVIRALVDRIEALEQQLQLIQTRQTLNESLSLVAVSAERIDAYANASDSKKLTGDRNNALPSHSTQCRLRDKIIEEFLDGSGI